MAGILKNRNPLGLTSLNHVSRNCADLNKSVQFYETVLGFVPIKRPGSFDFDGAW
jgi:catechol 2,3-dioxygenase-like lactoylglutathione lyase family enzyme